MNRSDLQTAIRSAAPDSSRCWPESLAFLAIQYGIALWRLATSSGGMMNKFSALARDQYLGFLVRQNLLMLVAYARAGHRRAPFSPSRFVDVWTRRSKYRKPLAIALRGFAIAAVMHGYLHAAPGENPAVFPQ